MVEDIESTVVSRVSVVIMKSFGEVVTVVVSDFLTTLALAEVVSRTPSHDYLYSVSVARFLRRLLFEFDEQTEELGHLVTL